MNITSNISLCSVPITPINQIDFATISDQFAYFNSKKVREFQPCKYTPRSGVLRISGYVDDLSDCNYGYYTNTYNGTSKTFYFWICAKELIAKNTIELTIQLDVFQTWLFDFELKDSFIVREHTDNDDIGANTYPESFELGDYVVNKRTKVEQLSGDVCYFIAVTDNLNKKIGAKFGQVYSGFKLRYYDNGDTDKLSEYIQELCDDGKADAIAFIFTYPKKMLHTDFLNLTSGDFIDTFPDILNEYEYQEVNTTTFKFKDKEYTPKNNKLLCYPFNFLNITDGKGKNTNLKYENFAYPLCPTFTVYGILSPNPDFLLVPHDYCGKPRDYEDSISCNGFPLCSWNNDNYSNWYASTSATRNTAWNNADKVLATGNKVARNNANTAQYNLDDKQDVGVMNNIASAMSANGILGKIGKAYTGGVNMQVDYNNANRSINNDLDNAYLLNQTDYESTISSLVAQNVDASIQPNTARGDTSVSGLDISLGICTFIINHMQIKPEYAEKIDLYFQMYGYQVNTIKKPNFKKRTRWDYIKTVNCNVQGNVPLQDRDAIASLFDTGLTVWHDEQFMFDYTQFNTIKGVN